MQPLPNMRPRLTHLAMFLPLLTAIISQAPAETRLRSVSAHWDLGSEVSGSVGGMVSDGSERRILNTALIGSRQLTTNEVTGGAAASSSAQLTAREIPGGFDWTASLAASTSAIVSNLSGHSASAGAALTLVFEVESDGYGTFSLPQALIFDVNAPVLVSSGTTNYYATAAGIGFDASPATFQIAQGVSEIRIVQQIAAGTQNTVGEPAEPNRAIHFNHSRSIHFTNLVIEPGALQRVPLLPNSNGGGGRSFTYTFTSPPPRRWYDPPMAQGFAFTATGVGKFTQIMGFPSGLGSAFRISVDGADLGSFPANGTVDFVALLGQGVSSFEVKGIQPFVDATSPTAFPIMLDFTGDMTGFTMASIAAPDIKLLTLGNGDLQITFDGVLQSSPDLSPTSWADVTPTPVSPFVVPKAQLGSMKFYRSRDPVTP